MLKEVWKKWTIALIKEIKLKFKEAKRCNYDKKLLNQSELNVVNKGSTLYIYTDLYKLQNKVRSTVSFLSENIQFENVFRTLPL